MPKAWCSGGRSRTLETSGPLRRLGSARPNGHHTEGMDMSPHTTTRLGVAIGTCLAALTFGGCGSSAAPEGEAVASLPRATSGLAPGDPDLEAPSDVDAAFALFESCLDSQGVEMPDLGGPSGGIAVHGDPGDTRTELSEDQLVEWEAAASTCEGHLANVQDVFDLDAEQQAKMMDSEAAFTECMIEQGVDPEIFAVPADGAEAGSDTSFEDVDPETFDRAISACSDTLAGVDTTADGS